MQLQMNPVDRAALEDSKDYLCNNLQSIPKLLGILRSKGVITKENEAELNVKVSNCTVKPR